MVPLVQPALGQVQRLTMEDSSSGKLNIPPLNVHQGFYRVNSDAAQISCYEGKQKALAITSQSNT